jgi:Tol biopolymer transport system component
MDLDGSNQKQLTSGKVEEGPSCSPDSKWVVYTAYETGKPTSWKISIEDGTPQQITDVACGGPQVSHDGKLVACATESPRGVMIFPFEGGKPVATVELPQDGWWDGSWTLDDRAIRYAMSDREANWGLYGTFNWWVQPIDGGSPKQLTFFKPDQPGATSSLGAAWSPDGKDLLYQHMEWKTDVVMMSGLR